MYFLQRSRVRSLLESFEKLLAVNFTNYHHRSTKTADEVGGNSIGERRWNGKTVMSEGQKRCFTRFASLGCANTKPHNKNYQPSQELAFPSVFPSTRKPARFQQRSILFLKTSALFKDTTFRPSSAALIESLETLPQLEAEQIRTFLNTASTDFSPEIYVKYFRSFMCKVTSSRDTSEFLSLGKRHVQKFSKRDLQELLKEIIALETKTPHDHLFLKVIDLECSRRASMWDMPSCLLCLDLWYAIDGYKLGRRKYWNILLREWESKSEVWSLQNMVQFLFYVGVVKSVPHSLLAKLECLLDSQINEASSDELGIICEGFFKSRYRLTSTSILSSADEKAKSLTDMKSTDSFSLIRLLKVLRHAQSIGDDLCCHLLTTLNTGLLDKCSLSECGHYAATLAAAKVYDINLFNSVEILFLQLLKKENEYLSTVRMPNFHAHPSLKSRPKDVSRILWSFSEVSHQVQNKNFDKIVINHLELCWLHGYFDREPHILLDCLLSLCIVNIYPVKLIKHMLSAEQRTQLISLQKDKPLKQLYTLSQTVALECSWYKFDKLKQLSDLCVMPNLKELEQEFQRRPALQVAATLLKSLINNDNLQAVRVLPCIGIAGFMIRLDTRGNVVSSVSSLPGVIENEALCMLNDNVIENLLGRNRRKDLRVSSVEGSNEVPNRQHFMAIEIIDCMTSVKGTNKPLGLMSLKIRLLNCLKCKVLLITQNQLQQIFAEDNEARNTSLKNLILQMV